MRRARQVKESLVEQPGPAAAENSQDMHLVCEAVLGLLDSWVLLVNSERRVLYASGSFCRSRCLEPRDCAGQLATELLAGGAEANRPIVDTINGALDSAMSGRGQARLSGLRLCDPGPGGQAGERVLDARVSPLPGREGLALLVLEDITEHWHAQEEVIREKRKLNDMVQATGAGLSLLDLDRRVTWANRVFVSWFGDPAGRHCHQVFRCTGTPCGVCHLDQVHQTGASIVENWATYTAGGMRRHFQNVVTPIRDEHGRIFQFLVLTQDVTPVEGKIEQLNLLRRLGEAMSGTLELDLLLRMILTCTTAGHALGFNRAFLFLRDRATNTLEARQAVGPTSREEAFRIWGELAARQKDIDAVFTDAVQHAPREVAPPSPLFERIRGLSYPLDEAHAGEILVRAALGKTSLVVTDAENDARVSREFRARMEARAFVVVSLVARNEVVGVVMADNIYSGRPITEEHTGILGVFANQAGLAIENARTYEELKDQMARLRSTHAQLLHSENLATIGRMAAHVAHEIRNPLTTVGGFARSILKNLDRPERIRDSAEVICEEVKRLEKILSNVMDFTRPAKPQLAPDRAQDLLKRVIHEQQGTLAARGVVLDADIDDGVPDFLMDAEKLKQVIINLLRNAAEAMPEGGAVRLSLSRSEELVRIAVADTGAGMTAAVLAKVFNPFFTTKQDGTGLGLALSRKIVEDHGGQLVAQSEPGKGTTFTISLPLHPRSAGAPEQDLEDTREQLEMDGVRGEQRITDAIDLPPGWPNRRA
jgi:hypothetical protein